MSNSLFQGPARCIPMVVTWSDGLKPRYAGTMLKGKKTYIKEAVTVLLGQPLFSLGLFA